MKIDLSFNAGQFDELQLREKNVIVLDVLRASSTITVALNNGAREIIPVASIESAVKISGSLFGEVTLRGGERNGKTIEGFNLGNSPLEYSETAVKGKSIIYCTTNGSVAMAKSRYARTLAVGSFINLTATTDFIRNENKDFLFLCAGRANTVGNFSLEDAVCAGMMIQNLLKADSLEVELSDSAKAAHALSKTFGRSILKMLKTSEHGKYLIEIGFAEDLKICAQVDSVPVLPILIGTVIKLKKEEPSIEPA
ncbi:MAG: 2-phosphosulfolactate phosphatase [Bacteroidota bacterium]